MFPWQSARALSRSLSRDVWNVLKALLQPAARLFPSDSSTQVPVMVQECGLVLEANMIEETSEWRTFSESACPPET